MAQLNEDRFGRSRGTTRVMKNLENNFFKVAVMLAVPASRETIMKLGLAGMALDFTARSLEQQPAAARLGAPGRKVQRVS